MGLTNAENQALKTNVWLGRQGRQAAHESIEENLYNECITIRYQEKPVKRWWFVGRGKQILDEIKPNHNFLFSNHWFKRFHNRCNISLRRKVTVLKNHSQHQNQQSRNFTLLCCDWEILVTLRHLISQIWVRRLYHLC